MIELNIPIKNTALSRLRAGDKVLLSGQIYTARDAAHKRLIDLINAGAPLPLELSGACIYYTGAAPAKQGEVIGACGPTSSARMDTYTPALIERGLSVMVGKGERSAAVVEAMRGKAVYLLAVGGAAVYYQQFVTSCEVIAYPELGTEAIHRLTVERIPLLVAIDSHGNNLFGK